MNTENSKTSEPHRFKLDLTDKLNLKNPNKNMALANLSIYYTWKNIKSEHNNNKFKISDPTWNDLLLIYQMVLTQYLTFKIILNLSSKNKKLSLRIHQFKFIQIKSKKINKIKNRIVFKVKTRYKLELLTPETMKMLKEDKDGKTVPKLESVEVVLVHCNVVKNDYRHTSKILFSFVPNKQFGQLINISPHSLTTMNTVNKEVSFAEVWFTDQASKALEIEDNVNLTLIIGQSL